MIPGNRVLIENPITRNLFRKIILCDFKASLDRGGGGGGGDMGSLWGECESRREMILSVLSPGHRYRRIITSSYIAKFSKGSLLESY